MEVEFKLNMELTSLSKWLCGNELLSNLKKTEFMIFGTQHRDRAAFLQLGGLNKMPKAFLARAAGASVLGGSGGMLPRKIFKINASRMAKNTSQYSRHSEFSYYLSG